MLPLTGGATPVVNVFIELLAAVTFELTESIDAA
jgi:hypothetical protein